MSDLETAARQWLAIDPDPATRAEVEALLADHDEAGLADRFGTRLVFGTAGLRGPLGAGPNRMNRVVVMQTSAGLARFLARRSGTPTAVVGHDARHNSARFARDAAEVLAAAGVAVVLLPRALPTPVLAFAVRALGADAGVMITASHNPAPDNGYKLYLGGPDEGAQLVAPDEAAVLAEIEHVVAAGGLPPTSSEVRIAGEDLLDRYVAATAALAATGARPALPWVYTPMHGVGLETVRRVLDAAGLPAPEVVPSQAQPDPDFPTAPFPNPEEPGTLDPAFAAATASKAALVLANDPDADRLAVALPEGDGYRRLTGNEVGLLLGWSVAEQADSGTLATSIVSTPGLRRIADRFGLGYTETLTGFKWIGRARGLVFGFEEALGYLVAPAIVHDKDGISALVVLLREALRLADRGSDLTTRLAEIEAAIGRFDSDQVSVRVVDLARIAALMARLRSDPPTAVGGLPVTAVDDLLEGGELPRSDVLRISFDAGARLVVRPSGTEPKLKAYLDVWSDAGSPEERRAETDGRLRALRDGVRALLA
ncbi:phospho-sugar mutase [Amnibacterium sp. CER49]|uniref:phospho-sugar mutase n=1 Tax=Amnibacterium sp. CER49 TaxID=3039161 RepID=UPI00244993E8|nr:phospho-sugar mutase [Amnibacterium sp. CER49]MDH2443104.1 phospho-sugar mutase [Amnibacterium sp. CER49]